MIDKTKAAQMGLQVIDSQSTNALFDTLKTHFPQTIKDGKADLNAIATLLGLNSQRAQGYELTFTGKPLAEALYKESSDKVLRLKESFCAKSSPNSNLTAHAAQNQQTAAPNSPNALIIGDNLDALKLLKAAYSEKIKMIYIDPPYNTTSDNFIYPDNFRDDYKRILREVGLLEVGEDGAERESETLKYFRNIHATRTHSGWLAFMLPRLKLARDLLREDGVIFISIDDNEQANLKLLCDDIFGEDCFVCNLIWRKIEENASSGGTMKLTKTFRKDHEYILCYAKQNGEFLTNKYLELPNFQNEYKNLDNDPRGAFKAGSISMKGTEKSAKYYEVETPSGKKYKRVWRITKDEFDELDKDNRIYYGKKGDAVPQIKIFINELRPVTPKTIFENLGSSFEASEQLKDILGIPRKENPIFDNPKPVDLIKRILEVSTTSNSNDLILDFFAGSGTTAQAVMELNAQDNGNRAFILVQLDEQINQDKSKTAYDFCKNELKSEVPVISDITAERVRRAALKIARNDSFQTFILAPKPRLISDEAGALSISTNEDLSAFDRARNLALQNCKSLSAPLEIIIAGKLYKCGDSFFVLEIDGDVLEILAKTSNENIVLDGFSDIDLEGFLNANVRFEGRLSVAYLGE